MSSEGPYTDYKVKKKAGATLESEAQKKMKKFLNFVIKCIEEHVENRFTGDLGFQVHMKEGEIKKSRFSKGSQWWPPPK